MTKEVTIHFMPNNPNGAGYRPEIEDVPIDLEEEFDSYAGVPPLVVPVLDDDGI